MAFDVQGALKAGHSQQDINDYLASKNGPMGGGAVGQVAHNVTSAIPGFLGGNFIREALGAAYEGSRAVGNAVGAKNMYTNDQGQDVQNPFLSNHDLEGYTSPAKGAMTGAGNTAEAMSTVAGAEGGLGMVKGLGNGIKEAMMNFAKPGNTVARAGEKIGQIIDEADKSIPAVEKQLKVNDLFKKHFGTVDDPNLNLLPNAPAQEQEGLKEMLKKEILNQGRDKVEGGPNIADIQNWKVGSALKGRFDKSITNSSQQLFQNISRAYGNVVKEAVPGIDKAYDNYSKAITASKEGAQTGIVGMLKRIQANPLVKISEVLGTGYVGYRGMGGLIKQPLNAVAGGDDWGANNQNGQPGNGW